MRRTFIAVFIWALIQAGPKKEKSKKWEASASKNKKPQTLTNVALVTREQDDGDAAASDTRLIIHRIHNQNRSQRSADARSVGSWNIRVNLRSPSRECGLHPRTLPLATCAPHFLWPTAIWLAVSVSVSMTLWLALRYPLRTPRKGLAIKR